MNEHRPFPWAGAPGGRFLAAFASAAAWLLAAAPATAAEPRPNVLFIAVDDLNDWVGCMGGHPQAKTPHIDRLAQRGVLFLDAHCAAPVCLASRTAVMSGRLPQQTGVYSNWGESRGKSPPRSRQLSVVLSAAGYETLGTGKIHHESAAALFDDYFDTEQRWSPFTEAQSKYTAAELPSKGGPNPRHLVSGGPGGRDWTLPLNGLRSERNPDRPEGESFDWGALPVEDEAMGDARITDWAVRRLAERRTKPFFLGVGYSRPHIPLFAPKKDFDVLPPESEVELPKVVPDDLADVGPEARALALDSLTAGTHKLVVEGNQWRSAVRAYLACTTHVDRQVGRLLDALDASEHADDTWIVFWSDHGWHLGEKEHWGKWTGWRAATRVPLVVVAPRRQAAKRGVACAEPVGLIDLHPTICEICGLHPLQESAGRSLVPLLKDSSLDSGRAVLTTFDPGNYALTVRGWRYLRYRGGEEELYDVKSDPHEWKNLAADHAYEAKRNELRRRLDDELRRWEAR